MSFKVGAIPAKPAFLLVLVLLALELPAMAQPPDASEDQVKAAFLFNFAKLGEWPTQVLPSGPAPLLIGVSGGDDEFISVLRTIVAGKASGTHALIIRAVTSEEEMKACQMVFFRATEKKPNPTSLQDLAHASVLLVGEDASFLHEGGMINLIREHASIRFEINSEALNLTQIRLSSKILALAKASEGSASGVEGERRVASRVPPEYPAIAQQMRLTGTVRVQARVEPNGKVKEVTVLGGHPLLAAALADAVRQWRYEPALKETLEEVKFSFSPQ